MCVFPSIDRRRGEPRCDQYAPDLSVLFRGRVAIYETCIDLPPEKVRRKSVP